MDFECIQPKAGRLDILLYRAAKDVQSATTVGVSYNKILELLQDLEAEILIDNMAINWVEELAGQFYQAKGCWVAYDVDMPMLKTALSDHSRAH